MNAPANIPAMLLPYGIPVPRDLPREMVIRLAIYNAAWKAEEKAGEDSPDADNLSQTRRDAFDILMDSPSNSASIVSFKLSSLLARFEAGALEAEELQPIFADLQRIAALPRAPVEIDTSSPFQIALSAYERANSELQAYSDNVHDPLVEAYDVARAAQEAGVYSDEALRRAADAESHAQQCYDVLLHVERQLLESVIVTQVDTLDQLHTKLKIMNKIDQEGRDAHTFGTDTFAQLMNDVVAIGLQS